MIILTSEVDENKSKQSRNLKHTPSKEVLKDQQAITTDITMHNLQSGADFEQLNFLFSTIPNTSKQTPKNHLKIVKNN